MRKRIYVYDEATGAMKPAWSENEPSYARAAGTRGELVVGVSQQQLDRMAERARKAREKAA